jgi:hypothetical protein
MIEDIQAQNQMYRGIKEQLMKELEFLTDYLMTMAGKALASTRAVNKLRQIVDDKKVEVETLRKVASGISSLSSSYIAVPDDPIDAVLA